MNGAGLRESGDGACVNERARALSHRRAVGRADVGRARLVFWDLGGQLELQQLWEKVECACVLCIDALCSCCQYYPEAHGVIFVIDSCAPDRLKDASEAFCASCVCVCVCYSRIPLR
jgi:hypothetical protein